MPQEIKDALSDFNLWKTIFSYIILGLLTFIAGWFFKQISRQKPKLILKKAELTEQDGGILVFRAVIINKGKIIAENIEANLEGITDPSGQPRDNFIPFPLHWMHDWVKQTEYSVSIYPRQEKYLDIGTLVREDTKNSIILSIKLKREVPHWAWLKPGRSILHITLNEKSGYVKKIQYIINWDGGRNIDSSMVSIK